MPWPVRICVVVTTYCRPEGLARLLDDIEREGHAADVRVFDDATPHQDAALVTRLHRRGWSYTRADAHHGKREWWRLWNAILADVRAVPATHLFFLQDDMRLCEGFFTRSLALWAAIPDAAKGSLDLHVSEDRGTLGSTCWTSVPARPVGDVVHSGWVDCAAFMCEPRLLDALGWRLEPVEHQHGPRRLASSGVGRQISLRAQRAGLTMYRVRRSLTVHDDSPSLLNPEARRIWPNRTAQFVDGDAAARAYEVARTPVFAAIASIPARERALAQGVAALRPQVDGLGVYLNRYSRVPAWLERDGVEIARSQDHGDRGDAGKFFWAGRVRGHHLVCDDDLLYPPDYVARLTAGIERHGRGAVVGFHGVLLREPLTDYHNVRRRLHWRLALEADTPVHVLGTGVAGFHSSALRVTPGDFHAPNMADLWLALLGQRQRVPFVCLAHEHGWLAATPDAGGESIYARARRRAARGETEETRIARAHAPWMLHGPAVTASPPRSPPAAGALMRRPGPPPPRRVSRRLVRVRVTGPTIAATLVLPDRDHITAAVRTSGTYYERDLLDAIRARSRGGTFVDVGAHYGNHTTFFALECGADQVVALEPHEPSFAGLTETLAENGLTARVDARRLAVHPTLRAVTLRERPFRPRLASRVHSNTGSVELLPASGAGAAAAPLDEALADCRRVAVIKVDTAVSSAELLRSARRVLRRDRPLVAAVAPSDSERHAVAGLLAPLGYSEVGRYCWTPTFIWNVAGSSRGSGQPSSRRTTR